MMRVARVAVALLLVAGCAAPGALDVPTQTTSAPFASSTLDISPPVTSPPVEKEAPASTSTLARGETLVLKATQAVGVYPAPGARHPRLVIPATTILGTPTVFTVVHGPVKGWARVSLPVRPNGSEGWVEVDSMETHVISGVISIDLTERLLTYERDDQVVLSTTVAIGTERNPTPTGTFYVTDSVTLADPNSPWGPHALGLSARSDTITEYNGGDGIIGIHGTNRPGSIGQAASLGCVRLPNDVISELHQMVPLGTPVVITS